MDAPIPMLDLGAQIDPLRKEIDAAIAKVIDSRAFILGPEVKTFEDAVARYGGVRHAIGCASGSDALVLALLALEVGTGDEVITTTFSFFATAGAIVRVGATPIFVDIDPKTFNLDVQRIEAKITDRTKAILPVHLYGQMTPMDGIMKVAKRYGLKVIEDAAQSIGAKEGQTFAGAVGDIGTLSFFPSKNLGGFGDGGMVLTQDDDLAEKLRCLRVHGTKGKTYHYDFIGLNSRLDTIQAAILSVKLPHLEAWTEGRRRNAAKYDRLFADADGVGTPLALPGMRHIYNQYTIRVLNRHEVMRRLQEERIGSAVYYPRCLHVQNCFAALGGAAGDCPEAERTSGEVLSIPVYAELTDSQIERIASVIKRAVAAG